MFAYLADRAGFDLYTLAIVIMWIILALIASGVVSIVIGSFIRTGARGASTVAAKKESDEHEELCK